MALLLLGRVCFLLWCLYSRADGHTNGHTDRHMGSLSYEMRYSLHEHLMQNYIKELHPTISEDDLVKGGNELVDESGKLKIVVTADIHRVLSIEEVGQTLWLETWMTLKWLDMRLAWETSIYNDSILDLIVDKNMLWVPDIVLYNGETQLDVEDVPSFIKIYRNGTVVSTFKAIHSATCKMNVELFPFDIQSCQMLFGSLLYDSSMFVVKPGFECGYINHENQQNEWYLRSYYTRNSSREFIGKNFSVVEHNILLERKPLYYLLNLGFPSFLAIILALVGFFTPTDTTGERMQKVQMGLTTLMNMTLLLLIVSKHIPATSETVPLITIYYCITMFIVCLGTSVTAILLSAQSSANDMRPLPIWLKIWAFRYLAMVFGKQIPLREIGEDDAAAAISARQKEQAESFARFGGGDGEDHIVKRLGKSKAGHLQLPELVCQRVVSTRKRLRSTVTQCPELGNMDERSGKRLAPIQLASRSLNKMLATCADANETLSKQKDKYHNWRKNRYEWQCAMDIIEALLLTSFLTSTIFITGYLASNVFNDIGSSNMNEETKRFYKKCEIVNERSGH